MVLSLASFDVRAQAVARINDNDSLIIHKNLLEVLVSGDQIEGEPEPSACHYSENIDELIEGKAGMSLTRRGNYGSEVIVRGMSSERVNTTHRKLSRV